MSGGHEVGCRGGGTQLLKQLVHLIICLSTPPHFWTPDLSMIKITCLHFQKFSALHIWISPLLPYDYAHFVSTWRHSHDECSQAFPVFHWSSAPVYYCECKLRGRPGEQGYLHLLGLNCSGTEMHCPGLCPAITYVKANAHTFCTCMLCVVWLTNQYPITSVNYITFWFSLNDAFK